MSSEGFLEKEIPKPRLEWRTGAQPKLKQNSYIEYTESETPYTAKYYILYSTSQDFSKYSILNAHLYARYVVGGFYSTLFSYKREKTIKDIQKYISNFWTEPGIIIGQSNYIPKK